MNEISADDLHRVLEHLGIALPYGLPPGSFPGGMKNSWTKVEWTSYRWNPPQFMQRGWVYELGEWTGPFLVVAELVSDHLFQDFAYSGSNITVRPALPAPTSDGVYPAGWASVFPGSVTWAIARRRKAVTAQQALSDRDPSASQKPTWKKLETAFGPAMLIVHRGRLRLEIREETRRRITLGYGEASWQDEMELRARGGETAQQDTERDRLRARYAALRTSLDTMTMKQLEAFDPSDDTHWVAEDTTGDTT